MSLSNIEIINKLNILPKETITRLSLNKNPPTYSVINSNNEFYCLEKYKPDLHDMDALRFENDEFLFIEFKDQKIPTASNKKDIAELIFKALESTNQVIEILDDELSFFNHKRRFIYVYSFRKNQSPTSINDLKFLKSFFKERYGKILGEILFIVDSEYNDCIQ